MKIPTLALAAALLGAPGLVLAQPAMNDHRTVHTERTIERTVERSGDRLDRRPDVRTRTERTTVYRTDRDRRDRAHYGWERGKHKGWRNRCGYRWKHGHRVHTCWRVRY